MASDCDSAPPSTNRFVSIEARAWNGIERHLGIPYPIWSLGSLFRLWQEVRRTDVVHLHDYLYFSNLFAFAFSHFARKPVIITQHIGMVPYKSRVLRLILSSLNRSVGRFVLRRATQVIFYSYSVSQYFSNFTQFQRSPRFIANGVDTTLFAPASIAQRIVLRTKLNVNADQFLLLFVGRFVEKKGLHIVRAIAEKMPETRFILAGGGPITPEGWALANITVLRDRLQEQLVPLYQACDLLILPSKGEGFPLVVQESLACGASAVVGIETAGALPGIEQFVSGVETETPDAADRWIAHVRQLLSVDTLLSSNLRPDAALFARATWSWELCAHSYASCIRDCATESA